MQTTNSSTSASLVSRVFEVLESPQLAQELEHVVREYDLARSLARLDLTDDSIVVEDGENRFGLPFVECNFDNSCIGKML